MRNMSKRRDSKIDEQLREYKAEIRQLKRQIKALQKGVVVERYQEKTKPDIKKKKKIQEKCPECFEKVEVINVGNRTFERCEHCGYRSRTRKA